MVLVKPAPRLRSPKAVTPPGAADEKLEPAEIRDDSVWTDESPEEPDSQALIGPQVWNHF